MRILFLLLISSGGLFFPYACHALEPHEVMVLANRYASGSVGLAEYYMEKREIPKENLLKLWITDDETCSREDYDRKVVIPLRKKLRENNVSGKIRCLLVMYGLPIRVLPREPTREERKAMEGLEKEQSRIASQIKDLKDGDKARTAALRSELEGIKRRMSLLDKKDQIASLDSEIALVLKEDYPLGRWVRNPFFVGYGSKEMMERQGEGVLMVSRLDGPSKEIVRRIIDESLDVERSGLKGTAYFDARWPMPKDLKKRDMGYAFYDHSIHKAAEKIINSGLMPVIVDDKKELFGPGQCPNAALYCGWYSLARYVDAFEWQPGSVGYHIASGECTTLRAKDSRVWCKMMLEKGVAATLGPVGEPYLPAFPIPELFFGFLLEGRRSLAECYALSMPYWSWKMILIGDPLYRPFKNRPHNPPEDHP